MPSSQAFVPTSRAGRYLAQLCKHTSLMGRHSGPGRHATGDGPPPPRPRRADWTGTEGIIDFGWGRCILRATDDALTLRAEADDEERLLRIQEGIGTRLARLGHRDQLTVTWQEAAPDALARTVSSRHLYR